MNNIYKLYSGDYSKDGAVHPLNYVWAFNNAYESFMKNYDKGYLVYKIETVSCFCRLGIVAFLILLVHWMI